METSGAAKRKKPDNAPATLALALGLFCVMAVGMSLSDWRVASTINEDPVTVRGKVTDIAGSGGMEYEYEFQGRKHEGTDLRRNARGKWVGAPIDIVLSANSPDVSSVDPDFLARRSREFGWGAAVLLALTAVAGWFGIRRARRAPVVVQVEPKAEKRGSASAAIIFLAGFALITTTAAFVVARLSGEGDWLQQAAATLNRPDMANDDKVAALSTSVDSRLEHLASFTPVLGWIVVGSVAVLVGTLAVMGYLRNRRG